MHYLETSIHVYKACNRPNGFYMTMGLDNQLSNVTKTVSVS